MKKLLSMLLVLLLIASVFPGAAAAGEDRVVLSPQKLRVNGAAIDCEKYNINDSNYFKLRDLALLLNGTGSQFSVGWDGEKKVVSIVSGEAYEPNGSELDLSAGDKSATAVPSTQTLMINGEVRTDLKAYNIGDNNFFKLRDLGDALGFAVDYDKPSNSAIVISKAASAPTPWLTVESVITSNQGYSSRTVETYSPEGRLLSYTSEGKDYKESTVNSYDELGRLTESTTESFSTYEGEETTYHSHTLREYNIWGLLARSTIREDGDVVTSETYTYDEAGRTLTEDYATNAGHTVYAYTYDGNGGLIKSETRSDDGYLYTTEYTRDEQGRMIRETGVNGTSGATYITDYAYDGDLLMSVSYTSGDYHSVTTYAYDAAGNCIRTHYESDDYSYDTMSQYDAQGRQTRTERREGDEVYVTEYAYDSAGRTLWEKSSGPDDWSSLYEYAYDGEGREILYRDTSYGVVTERVTVYDTENGKKTLTTTTTYPAATGLSISEEAVQLAKGDSCWLYTNVVPSNAVEEPVTWSSSNPNVAKVDAEGNVKAVTAGTAIITAATESGLFAECEVTVAPEKFILTAEPTAVALRVGRTVSVLCSVEVIGSWASYTLRFANNYDRDLVSLSWDEEWDNGTINLNISGIATGKTSVDVYTVRDGVLSEEPVTISITVVN